MRKATEASMITAQARIDVDPNLFDSLDLVGPIVIGKTGRRFRLGPTDGKQIDDGLRAGLVELRPPSNTRLGLGFVVVGDDPIAAVQTRLASVSRDAELAALHPVGRGISFSGGTEPTAEVAAVELSAGVARLDSSIVSAAVQIRAEHFADDSALIDSVTLSQLVPELTLRAPDEPPAALVAQETDSGRTAASMAPPLPQPPHGRPAADALALPRAPLAPLRLTYLVIDSSQDSKPRRVRARLSRIAQELDRLLVPRDDDLRSETVLVGAGAPNRVSDLKPTGGVRPADFWRASNATLDLAATMTQLRDLIIRNKDSKTRRREELITPLVIFILPTAAMFGAATLMPYRQITHLAEIGWFVTRTDGPPPSIEIDPDRLVYDHSDAINELLYKIGYPEAPLNVAQDQQADAAQTQPAPGETT
jgi:hypothetical protein